MKKTSPFIHLLVITTAFLPMAYLAITWPGIPETVPIHYNLNMEPDKIGNKSILWWPVAMVAAVSILIYFVMLNIRKLDPKQRKAPPSSTFQKLAIVIVVFLTLLNFLIVISASSYKVLPQRLFDRLLFTLVALLLAFIGNYMNNLKPNYFAGIRIPWTLNSDYNWRKTHQLAGKLWFWGGLIMAVLFIFIPVKAILTTLFVIIGILIIVPIIYSYRLFKIEKSNG